MGYHSQRSKTKPKRKSVSIDRRRLKHLYWCMVTNSGHPGVRSNPQSFKDWLRGMDANMKYEEAKNGRMPWTK